ncbi:MAG: hypothetical protein ABR978_04375 [Dehalococcoidia bacterium]|jgi:hypothetical protein
MLSKRGTLAILTLALGVSTLAALTVRAALGLQGAESDNSGNAFTSAPSFTSTGYLSPSAQAADTGGDNDGFELNPTDAYADDSAYATNLHGPGDRHRYYNYGFSIPSGSAINGIRVRLDWWVNNVGGDNSMSAELSWDGGTTWTAAETDVVESTSEHTAVLGGPADTWGRTWSPADFSDANFRVRLTCNCTGAGCASRDFYLDWVAVSVYYTPP